MVGKNNLELMEKMLHNLVEQFRIVKDNEFKMNVALNEYDYFDTKKDIQKEIDSFISNIAENIQNKFCLNEKQAFQILDDGITEMVQDGILPEFPDRKKALTENKITWFEIANMNGLNGYCMKLASDLVFNSKCEKK